MRAPEVTTPAGWPAFGEEERAAVAEVLRSGRVNYWTGEEGTSFEAEYAQRLGVRHAVAVANGTLALELALRALRVGAGDEVIVPSRTFIATAGAVVAVGARPVCADVDPDSQGITLDTVLPVVTERTRAVIPVHLGGWPVEMEPLTSWARSAGVLVVEDCAQAHGALLAGREVGTFGDAAAFSFCQDKILTTAGEGGLLVTDDDQVFERAWSHRDHGKSFEAVFRREHPPGFRWLHEEFGTNGRMTEVQAAVGRVALRRLPEWLDRRRRNAAHLTDLLGGEPALSVAAPAPGVQPSWYRWYARVRREALAPGWDRDRVLTEVAARGVPCSVGSCPEIYLEEAFPPEWRPRERWPVARDLGETSLALLVHPTLARADVERSATVLAEVLEQASA